MAYPKDELWYTDDTQMAIGVAETLVACGEIQEAKLCQAFVSNYLPSRGYGQGARAVLDAMEEGEDYRRVANEYFPGGSYGNGAAMRVAPIGLLFASDPERLWKQAKLSALPTHIHPLGIEGVQLLALAVALCTTFDVFNRKAFFDRLQQSCQTPEFRERIQKAAEIESVNDLAGLGNGIQALESVVTAIASFALTPDSYAETIGNVILLGGDTDTLAAMAGALSGAYLGLQAIPPRLIILLESSPQGRDYLLKLADQLHQLHSGRS